MHVKVPNEYVKNNEIVLNVGFEATSGLKLGNEFIEFKARFGGVPRDIVVPIDHVVAIYARENGQGMAFPVPTDSGVNVPGSGAGARDEHRPATAGTVLRLAGSDATPEPPSRPELRVEGPGDEDPPPGASPGGRPTLKRVK